MGNDLDLLFFQLPGGLLLMDATAADLQAATKFYAAQVVDSIKNPQPDPWWRRLALFVVPLWWLWGQLPAERARDQALATGKWLLSIERELRAKSNATVGDVLTERKLRELQKSK